MWHLKKPRKEIEVVSILSVQLVQLQEGGKHAVASLTVNVFREDESVGVTLSSSAPRFTKQAVSLRKKRQK